MHRGCYRRRPSPPSRTRSAPARELCEMRRLREAAATAAAAANRAKSERAREMSSSQEKKCSLHAKRRSRSASRSQSGALSRLTSCGGPEQLVLDEARLRIGAVDACRCRSTLPSSCYGPCQRAFARTRQRRAAASSTDWSTPRGDLRTRGQDKLTSVMRSMLTRFGTRMRELTSDAQVEAEELTSCPITPRRLRTAPSSAPPPLPSSSCSCGPP